MSRNLQGVTCPLCNLYRNFFGLAMIAQSKLVLHDAMFPLTCLATLEIEIHCKLEKTLYMLQSRAAICNVLKTNSMQSLWKVKLSSTLCTYCKPKKSFQTSCKEEMLHAATYLQLFSQRHCNKSNKSCKENCTV